MLQSKRPILFFDRIQVLWNSENPRGQSVKEMSSGHLL